MPPELTIGGGAPDKGERHASWCVTEVLDLAKSYGETTTRTITSGTAGMVAVECVLREVVTPYVWGGETPGVGFDCSGPVMLLDRPGGKMTCQAHCAGPPVILAITRFLGGVRGDLGSACSASTRSWRRGLPGSRPWR
ncbi:MAG: hypothetical protein M0T80_03620 [Actinomycetota bacterium]|nr:hypothetical protein [Actinomycetota bacterium]